MNLVSIYHAQMTASPAIILALRVAKMILAETDAATTTIHAKINALVYAILYSKNAKMKPTTAYLGMTKLSAGKIMTDSSRRKPRQFAKNKLLPLMKMKKMTSI